MLDDLRGTPILGNHHLLLSECFRSRDALPTRMRHEDASARWTCLAKSASYASPASGESSSQCLSACEISLKQRWQVFAEQNRFAGFWRTLSAQLFVLLASEGHRDSDYLCVEVTIHAPVTWKLDPWDNWCRWYTEMIWNVLKFAFSRDCLPKFPRLMLFHAFPCFSRMT